MEVLLLKGFELSNSFDHTSIPPFNHHIQLIMTNNVHEYEHVYFNFTHIHKIMELCNFILSFYNEFNYDIMPFYNM